MIAVEGAYVITMDGPDIPGGTVLVGEDGAIAAVGAGGAVAVPPQATRLPAAGHALLPGLVNCHNHAAMALLRGYGADLPLQRWLQERIFPAEARLRADDVYWGTLAAAAEMLRGGTTCFADMYFFEEEAARAVDEAGMRAVLSRGLVGLDPVAAAKLAEAEAFCRRFQGAAGGRITTMMAPHAEYTCPEPFLREIDAAARRLGRPLHLHLAETAAEVAGCRDRHQGRSPVRYLHDLGLLRAGTLVAHCVHVDGEDIALLAASGAAVAHNPASNCKLGSGIAPAARLHAAGARIGLGTDGPASTDSISMWETMRLAGWLAKATDRDAAALPARTLLGWATRDAAAALGLGQVCGRIAPGLRADLCLVDLRAPHLQPCADVPAALVYAATAADVVRVWVDGVPVVEAGRPVRVDTARALAECSVRMRRLIER
jgi:5-methylthioadenosine/S-adenosylhomocysteine deaminase